jgi:hypothetical protein
MSEANEDAGLPADQVRQHPQDPAEGPDEETEDRSDVPRVHAEDPAEG